MAMPSFLPSGDMHVPQPEGDAAWSECLRDLKRTFEGGSLSVLGRGRRFTVHDPAKELGDVSQKACEQAFDELARIIEFERQAQAMGLPPDVTAAEACWHPGCARPARHEGPCVDGFLRRLELPEGCEAPLTPELLKGLTRRVAASISVVPGMQAVMSHELPPALWQPSFVVCIGSGQVRVLTMAFVGEPVCGDRPSSKSTPYVLRLLTEDLVVKPESQGPSRYCVRHALTNAKTMALHLTDLDEELFEAAGNGDWTSITKVAKTTPPIRLPAASSGRTPSVGLDRASRMRASLERAQMRPEQNRSDSVSRTPPFPVTPPAIQTPPPAVSVLADGLSVKAVTSALNNMANGAKLGMFISRARGQSPGLGLLAEPPQTSEDAAGWRKQPSFRSIQQPTGHLRGVLASPLRVNPPAGHLRGVLASPPDGKPPLHGTASRRPASSIPRKNADSAPPLLPMRADSAPLVKPPVMDRAARMRDRIQRNQARASSKDPFGSVE